VRTLIAAALLVAGVAVAQAGPLDDMLAFDTVYIPALSLTGTGGKDAASAARADAAMKRLVDSWPDQRGRLQAVWPGDADWSKRLDAVQRDLVAAQAAVQRRDWTAAHEALEPVRITLMQARQARGVSYYVDRLTAFHAPMESLAQAGATLRPEQLTAARRASLDQTYAQARALWLEVERDPADARSLQLDAARERQWREALADETRALSRLSQALRSDDGAALLQAAAAVKPPFARAFTSLGRAPDAAAPLAAH